MNFFPLNLYFLVYAIGGFLGIMTYLLATGHARLTPSSSGIIWRAACGDIREVKQVVIFGGASAFTFGIPYLILAQITTGWLHQLAVIYFLMQIGITIVQLVTTTWQLGQGDVSQEITIQIKAHLDGCGFTTAWSPIWPLYFLDKLIPNKTVKSWIMSLRDFMTRLDYGFSHSFGWLLLSLIALSGNKRITFCIGHVDNPHPTH